MPAIKPASKLVDDLALSKTMREAPKHDWNEMREHYGTGADPIRLTEAEELEKTGDAWVRISGG